MSKPRPPTQTEREFQTALQEVLGRERYAWQHVFRMQTAKGAWRTSTTANGWPDLVAFRGETLLAIECKGAKGRMEPGQVEWLERFHALGYAYAWVLRPTDDLQAIANWIHRPATAPRRHGW